MPTFIQRIQATDIQHLMKTALKSRYTLYVFYHLKIRNSSR